MKTLLTGCAIALALGSMASASDQLARQLGVEPGVYTTAELTRLKAAMDDDDRFLIESAMKQTDVVVSTQSIGVARGDNSQLGAAIRVDASDFADAELAKMFFDITADDD